jgi:hypothetical protein
MYDKAFEADGFVGKGAGGTFVSSVIVSDDGSEYVTVALDSGETVTGTLASKR